jgi:hypothetical protein
MCTSNWQSPQQHQLLSQCTLEPTDLTHNRLLIPGAVPQTSGLQQSTKHDEHAIHPLGRVQPDQLDHQYVGECHTRIYRVTLTDHDAVPLPYMELNKHRQHRRWKGSGCLLTSISALHNT